LTPSQAALFGEGRLHNAQRQSVASHIGRTQGNQHVQRVVGGLQVQQQNIKGAREKREQLRQALRDILALEWQAQSGTKRPIQLTTRLSSVLRVVTGLSAQDLQLLWRKPPRTPGEALRSLVHSLPKDVKQSTLDKLQQARLNLVTFRGGKTARPAATKTPPSAAKPTPAAIAGIEGKEALFKAIAYALQGVPSDDKSQGTEAVKKSLEAFLATDQGKKIKEKALALLLSSKGLPFTLFTGSAALAAMVVNNTDIPSTPEIPLSDNLTIKAEFKGTFQKPEAISFVLKFKFGGPAKQEQGGKQTTVLALPPELHVYIDRIDRRTLSKWFAQRAFWEWEMSGPDTEQDKLKFYRAARDRPDALGLPDTRLVAEGLSRTLVEAAIQNRIYQLKGKPVRKQVHFDLGSAAHWDRLTKLDGLRPRLSWLLNLLIPKVPYGAQGIEKVVFRCGTRHGGIAVPISR
jgi:hypothetical protein